MLLPGSGPESGLGSAPQQMLVLPLLLPAGSICAQRRQCWVSTSHLWVVSSLLPSLCLLVSASVLTLLPPHNAVLLYFEAQHSITVTMVECVQRQCQLITEAALMRKHTMQLHHCSAAAEVNGKTYRGVRAATSICLSGCYEDDHDSASNIITYTGENCGS